MAEDIIDKEIKEEEKPERKPGIMTRKVIWIIVIFILANIIFSSVLYFLSNKEADIIIFTRYDCPHCENLKNFINDNNLTEKLEIDFKEIHIASNRENLNKTSEKCNIPADQRGVPMLYYNNTCYLGDIDSIDILKQIGGIV